MRRGRRRSQSPHSPARATKNAETLNPTPCSIEISCKGKTTHQTVPAADEMLMDYHSQETEAPDRKTEPSGGFEAGMRREFSTESLEGMDHSGLIKFRGWNVEDEAPLVRLARPCTNVESPRASVNFTPDAALPHFSRSRSFNSNASDKFAAMRSSPSTPIISNLSSTSRGVGVSSPVFQPRSPKQHDSLELGPPALVGHSSSTYSTSGLAPEALQRVESSDSVVSEIFCVLNERMDYQVEPLCGAESTDSLSNSAAATGSFASDDLPLDGNVPEIEGSFAKLGNRLAHAESFIRSMVKDTT